MLRQPLVCGLVLGYVFLALMVVHVAFSSALRVVPARVAPEYWGRRVVYRLASRFRYLGGIR